MLTVVPLGGTFFFAPPGGTTIMSIFVLSGGTTTVALPGGTLIMLIVAPSGGMTTFAPPGGTTILLKHLGFSVGTGLRTLSSANKKQSDFGKGRKEGWIMLTGNQLQTKYTDELLDALEYSIQNNELVQHSPFKTIW